MYFEVAVLLRKATAASAVLSLRMQGAVAQAAALTFINTAYAAVVLRYRPFAASKGTFFGVRFDVLNAYEIVASSVVALNQWVYLLTGSATIPSTNAWGVPLMLLNLCVIAALGWRVIQLGRKKRKPKKRDAASKKAAADPEALSGRLRKVHSSMTEAARRGSYLLAEEHREELSREVQRAKSASTESEKSSGVALEDLVGLTDKLASAEFAVHAQNEKALRTELDEHTKRVKHMWSESDIAKLRRLEERAVELRCYKLAQAISRIDPGDFD